MPIRLIKPANLTLHPVGAGVVFADGSQMRPDHNGHWVLADDQQHQLSRLLMQGWRKHEEKIVPKYRSEFERVAIESPLSISEIVKLCESENVKFRAHAGDLEIRPLNAFVSGQLLAHLQLQRIPLRNFFEAQNAIEWKKV